MASPVIPKIIQHDANGLPAVGWKLHVYEVGTTTPKSSYSDAALATLNTTPIVLDSLGMASLYYSGKAKLVMTDDADVIQWTEQDISYDNVFLAPTKAVPIGADSIGFYDSVAGLFSKFTFTNLLTFLESATQTFTNKDSSASTNVNSPVTAPPVSAGTSSAYTVAGLPATLTANRVYLVRFDQSNASGGVTLAPGGGSAISIKLRDNSSDPREGQISAGIHSLHYNGTNLLLLDPATVSGSYTGTLTGCTTSPTETVSYNITGNIVHIMLPADISGTSNTTACTITGAPAIIRPAALSGAMPVSIRDNSVWQNGVMFMETNGTITVNLASYAAHTASGLKSVSRFEASYIL